MANLGAGQNGWLARFNGNPMQQNGSNLANRVQREIFGSGGRAGVQDDHVTICQRGLQRRFDLHGLIGHNRENFHLAAKVLQQTGENRAVKLNNVARARIFTGRDQFVAGRD